MRGSGWIEMTYRNQYSRVLRVSDANTQSQGNLVTKTSLHFGLQSSSTFLRAMAMHQSASTQGGHLKVSISQPMMSHLDYSLVTCHVVSLTTVMPRQARYTQ